jgi:hypothetical protein
MYLISTHKVQRCVNFGHNSFGRLYRKYVELCNTSTCDHTVYIHDPKLPFLVSHCELRLRARSFVRLSVQFVPVAAGEYHALLIGQVEGDEGVFATELRGSAQ